MVKKILNGPADAVPELLEGLELAGHGRIRKLPGLSVAVKSELSPGKAGLVIGAAAVPSRCSPVL